MASHTTPFSTLSSKAPQEPSATVDSSSATIASPPGAEPKSIPKAIDPSSANATNATGPASASSTAAWSPRPKAVDRNMSWSEQDMKHKFQERLTAPKDDEGFSSAAEDGKAGGGV